MIFEISEKILKNMIGFHPINLWYFVLQETKVINENTTIYFGEYIGELIILWYYVKVISVFIKLEFNMIGLL